MSRAGHDVLQRAQELHAPALTDVEDEVEDLRRDQQGVDLLRADLLGNVLRTLWPVSEAMNIFPCSAQSKEADSSLKSIRLACISECEHHNGAEQESLDEVGSDRSLRCLEG